MTRLFLIGNGYDISRRGDTSYKNFKTWLETEYGDIKKEVFIDGRINYTLFNKTITHRISVLKELFFYKNANEEEKANVLFNNLEKEEFDSDLRLTIAILFESMKRLNDEANWKHFEENLAAIPFKDFIEEYRKYNKDNLIEKSPSLGSPVDYETEILCSNSIRKLFSMWIANLPKMVLQRKAFENYIISSIRQDDIFIIFNYTKTIEEYFCNSDDTIFYHLHGIADNKDSIIVGHNCKEKSKGTPLDNEDDYINESYADLYKKPEMVIKNNTKLWDKISNSKELDIYEYGWSCSDVDSDYLKKIVSLINSNNIPFSLYLNNFNDCGRTKMKKWIECGLNINNGRIVLYLEEDNKIKYQNSIFK
ncbi:MAG: AbiH family protein [Bacilli bacterium]